MTSWLEMEQFQSQIKAENFPGFDSTAPCPSDFAEGDSYWIKNFVFPGEEEATTAPLPEQVDVVIIGSGITGAAVAYRLAQRDPSLRVAMVEARGLCSGATGRNGGHIARAEAFDFRHVVEKFGAEDAVRVRALGNRNRDMMLEAIDELNIADEVDLRLTGSAAVFGSANEREEFVKDMEIAKELGLKCEGFMMSPEEVLQKYHVSPEIAKHGAAGMEKAGSIYPRKLIAAMIRHVKSRMPGFTLHPYNPVSSVFKNEPSSGSNVTYRVDTAKGTIQCRAVVHATNAYANRLLPSLVGTKGVFGCRCEVVAIQPNTATAAEAPLNGGFGYDQFWHWIVQRPNNGPFIYGWSSIESLLDYDDSTTLPESDKSRAYMKGWLEDSFPNNFESIEWSRDVKNMWSGIQGYTLDGSSLVGRPTADSLGEFMSVGHNGEGMGRCFACATVLVDKMLQFLEGKEAEGSWSAPEWFPRAFLRNI